MSLQNDDSPATNILRWLVLLLCGATAIAVAWMGS